VAEVRAHADFCGGLGIPVFGEVGLPGTSEAGDIVWLDSRTLLIGEGYRTNKAGIEQMRTLLSAKGVEVFVGSAALRSGAIGVSAFDVADEHAG